MSQNNKILVFMVDRCQIVREGFEALLTDIEDIQYAGGADGGEGTLATIKMSSANVALVSVNTYSPKEVGTCFKIIEENPEIKLFCLLTEPARGVINDCISIGAAGIMVRESSFAELVAAIRKICSDERHFDSKIMAVLASDYADLVIYDSKRANKLSDRELNIIGMTANGKSVIQIARIIGKSSKTVDAARRNVMTKLGIGSIAELTKYAIKHGLSSLD